MPRLVAIGRFLKDLGAYQVLRPYDIFPGFFLSSFALVALVLLLPDYFAQWPGYSALASAGGSNGGGRFLIDASLPVAIIYIVVVALRLNKSRYLAVNQALQTNTVHRYPLIGAVFFIVQFPLLVLLYQRQDDFVYTLTENFWVVAYCMPWFSYLAANSFAVIVVSAQTKLQAQKKSMKLSATLNHRYIFLAIVLLAVLCCLPMLGNGLFLDDYPQRIAMFAAPDSNLFDFFSRGSALTEAQVQSGILPWWMWDTFKVRFYRPIGELLIHLDYALWPDNFALMHLHSIAWYGLLVAMVAVVYRQLLSLRWVAALAALLFALDYGHSAGVAWLCNRNVIVAMCLSMLCLYCHRRDTRWMSTVATGLFALSLAASEAALAITGYLLAHELYLTRHSNAQRALRLLPYALIGMCWIGFWLTQGYGVSGPGFYIDVAHQPLLFIEKLFYRAPAYVLSQLAFPPVEVFGALELSAMPSFAPWLATAFIFASLAVLFGFFRPLLKQFAVARFFALGMLIAALPLAASSPVSRSLWYVGFGALGLVALYIAHYRELVHEPIAIKRATIFAKTLIALHLVLGPLLFLLVPQLAPALDTAMDSQTVALPTRAENPRILLLSSPTYIGSVTFPMLKDEALAQGQHPSREAPTLTHIRGLVDAEHSFTLQRLSADALRVSSEQGFAGMASKPYGFAAGHQVLLDDVRITIERVNAEDQPVQISYVFTPDTLAGYSVMRWQGEGFVSAQLPVIGRMMTVN